MFESGIARMDLRSLLEDTIREHAAVQDEINQMAAQGKDMSLIRETENRIETQTGLHVFHV